MTAKLTATETDSGAFRRTLAGAEVQLSCGPQSSRIPHVRWTLGGDPLASATVTFDQKTGAFTVHCSFSMSASYDWLGNAENAPSAYPAYDALLCWDGQAFVLVTIQSADS
jgi:hypothetical protein